MDLITTAIITALNHNAPDQMAGESMKPITEAYQALRVALRVKFGAESQLMVALENLEVKPDSFGRQEVLKEEISATQANQDSEVQAAARTLLDRLDTNALARPAADRPIPWQRPARPSDFVGRETALTELLAHLKPDRVVALYGPAGIGKSALIAEAVWTLAPNEEPSDIFPDGIIYHNFYDQPRADIVMEHIARIYGEDPHPNAYDAAQRALAQRQALLILNGVELADDLTGILEIRGHCGVVVTCQHSDDVQAEKQEIEPLPLDQAATLLRTRAGAYATDQTAVQQICELVGCLPLAISLAGCYLAATGESATDYLIWLHTTVLTDLDWHQRQRVSIPLLIEHSLTQVGETTRQALAVVGLLALAPFEEQIITETLAVEVNQGLVAAVRKIFQHKPTEQQPDFQRAVTELVHYGLLSQVGQRCQVAHVLVHNYAKKHLTAPAKALRRLAASYVALAWEQSALGPEGYAVLDANRPHIMKTLTECLQWEDWEAAYSLAAAIEDYLDRQGYWSERVIANEIGLITAWQLGRPNEGAWLSNLGDTYRTMGHARWAIKHFEKALATARQNHDQHSAANSLGNLGLAYRDLGQLDMARQYLEQALAIFEEIRSPSARFVQDWLNNLGKE